MKKKIKELRDELGLCAVYRDAIAHDHRKQGGLVNPLYIANKAKSDVYREVSGKLSDLLKEEDE